MYPSPRLLAAGESGLVVEFSDRVDVVANLATRLLDEALPGAISQRGWPAAALRGTMPTYRSLLVLYDPLRVHPGAFGELLRQQAEVAMGAAEGRGRGGVGRASRLVEIPVCYEGDLAADLPEVADMTGRTPAELIELHTGQEYLVHMIGFQIGYPYMASLPEPLRLPRLARPRLSTPVGSVAIAGELTGIYSLASPGGWRILGTTPLPMWDLGLDPPTLLETGDRVRFRPISRARFDELRRAGAPGTPQPGLSGGGVAPAMSPAPDGEPALEVLSPGLLTTVQDLGRQAYRRYGIGPGGAMDKFALRVGNRLLGNPECLAALEVTGPGARFGWLCDTAFVWTGAEADLLLDGRRVAPWTVIPVRQGQVLTCASMSSGLRGYLCIAGGCAVPVVLGSRSTYLAAGFGGLAGRRIVAGDVVRGGAAVGAREAAASAYGGRRACRDVIDGVYRGLETGTVELDLVPGPQDDYFSSEAWSQLGSAVFRVSADSNRMGYRLEGPRIEARLGHDIVSDGLAEGAVQVPGNGQPVLLMADHQTTGGYPKPGVVAAASMPLAAQLRPGAGVCFRVATREAAVAGRLRLEHAVAGAVGELRRWRLGIDGCGYDVAVDLGSTEKVNPGRR